MIFLSSLLKKADWASLIDAMSRYVIYEYLSSKNELAMNKTPITSVSDAYDNEKWEEFVKSIEKDILIEKLGKKKANEFNPFRGFVDDQFQWSHGFRGKILLSDISDKTAYFDEGLNMKPHHNRTPFDEDIKTLRTYLAKL